MRGWQPGVCRLSNVLDGEAKVLLDAPSSVVASSQLQVPVSIA
jgi:hypothetical protein